MLIHSYRRSVMKKIQNCASLGMAISESQHAHRRTGHSTGRKGNGSKLAAGRRALPMSEEMLRTVSAGGGEGEAPAPAVEGEGNVRLQSS